MRLRSFLVPLCVVALSCGSLTAQAKSSTPTSSPQPIPSSLSEPLWQTLLPLITGLPASFKAYQDNLTAQIGNLQSTMLSLQSSNSQLQQDNASLQESLEASQVAAETSQKQSQQLQTDLDASGAFTIQVQQDLRKAQSDAQGLEAQVSVLRIGCITLGVSLGAVAVYEGGRVLHLW